ncbi:FtsX-like permease family protein [Nonomuraea glycinis]|uniref:FtsX-like permease family protein n=1 Tax=Nonomuraea glycinis TaxID=2047744 RepID=UPI002E12612B|nr:ABC transporter permease [Nonomuraea glycinis]
MSALVAALRIARRDALRAKGRSALIMAMIGLPVLVITGLLTGFATAGVSPAEQVTARLGAADARIATSEVRGPIAQTTLGYGVSREPTARSDRPRTAAEVTAVLDGRLIPYDVGSVEVRRPDGYDVVSAIELDLRDPMTRGIRPLVQGRFPASPGEVAVTPEMIERGVRLGGTISVTPQERQVRVVGVVEHPHNLRHKEVVGFQNVLLLDKRDGRGTGWLADTPAPVLWQDVLRLNGVGLTAASRAVLADPPPTIDFPGFDAATDPRMLTTIAAGVVLAVLETVLLAGPAFAVGLRRRRRELALIAAQGGSGAHLRAIVLADGLVLGGAATLLGAVLGTGGALVAVPILARWTGGYGPPEVPWLPVLGAAALGLLSAVIAALVPAVQAARQHPAQVLAGRESEQGRRRAGRPILGLLLITAGLCVTALSLDDSGPTILVGGVLVVFGLVAVMPWLVQAAGRLAARLPLPLRLSVRDAARHRVRTACAAAAVMAATMGAISLGIGAESQDAAFKASYRPKVPTGTLTITARSVDDRGWADLRAAATKALPGVSLISGQRALTRDGRPVTPVLVPQGCHGQCGVAVDSPIGDAGLLALVQGRADPRAAAALAEGRAVVFDDRMVKDGTLTVELSSEEPERRSLRIPAVTVTAADPRQIGAVLPPEAFTEAGFKLAERRLYAAHRPADLPLLERRLSVATGKADVHLESGPGDPSTPLFPTLLGVALVLGLGGTFAATGLAAADMRRDLDTVSAVGAPPRVRRLIVAAQAGFVAGLGTLVGAVAGGVMGTAASWPMSRHARTSGGPLDYDALFVAVPWSFTAAIVVGLPLLAALVAGLVTRARPTLTRRLA